MSLILISFIGALFLPIVFGSVSVAGTVTATKEVRVGEKDASPGIGKCYYYLRASYSFNDDGSRNSYSILEATTWTNQAWWGSIEDTGGSITTSTWTDGDGDHPAYKTYIHVDLHTWYWFVWHDEGDYSYSTYFFKVGSGVGGVTNVGIVDNRIDQWGASYSRLLSEVVS